jgi:hypothetical protein
VFCFWPDQANDVRVWLSRSGLGWNRPNPERLQRSHKTLQVSRVKCAADVKRGDIRVVNDQLPPVIPVEFQHGVREGDPVESKVALGPRQLAGHVIGGNLLHVEVPGFYGHRLPGRQG